MEPVKLGLSASAGPFGAPPELVGSDRSAPSRPFEQKEGLKRQHADEVRPGSGGPTSKHHHSVASR